MMQRSATTDTGAGPTFTSFQTTVLVILRILVGWHFFYEGLAKLFNPYWTSAGYLAESQWWFKGFFLFLASSPSALTVVDVVNSWGLTVIGLALMLGFLTRSATVGAIILLFLYYIAAPPFAGYQYSMPTEGSYLVVNKTLIELAAAFVLLGFPTGRSFGLDALVLWRGSPRHQKLIRANV